jgi:hypothetical protein
MSSGTEIGPASTVAGLDDREIAVLHEVGLRWGWALRDQRARLRALPVDPGLHRFPRSPTADRGGRFSTVDFRAGDDAAEVVATSHAGALPSGFGRVVATSRRVLCGPPLAASAVTHERMPKSVALAILSSDALPLVAYGPEAMLTVTGVLPDGIVKHRWHEPLHNGIARRLRRALRHQRGILVTTVAHHVAT